MAYLNRLIYKDVPFFVLSEDGGRYLCFNMKDQTILELFRSENTDKIIECLQSVTADFDEMVLVFDFEETPWHFSGEVGEPPDDIEDKLLRIINSRYAGDQTRKSATEILNKRRRISQKRVEQKVKNHLMTERRKEFQQNRNDLWLALIDRDGLKCNHPQCEEQIDLTIDHIIPLSRGGTDDLENLQFLCRFHNSQKNDSM